ncbi:3-oxoacyl-[acyl-carrier-protein] reductase FabG [Biomphalaria glabrata]|uniref:3-oxoacyl-[acyl-carrier-protein] reductase FabG-like n=1 Tax=Biomphalaria glabrata TaxID=6526 RepID=A0A2C9M799_BIOGL|nr:3-oxoacyl-[acyl-carrier-protein] reductase FabG-like [Biomphalaria glabrata]KAI8748444.1 3-oxoacyl-[acyl-carrier-protein] reductase FabG-like [Biomphalaria glabrata]KAI8779375.1 3-oxoacyl-[acyl-carrier-protein] reductase FabG [Biomphalaria glabrata]
MACKNFLNLRGKCVIITGASAGIGEATALEFARQNCNLMLCGRDKKNLENVSANCLKEGDNITVQTTIGDITESAVQKKIVENTIAAFGGIDILVNNAGMNILRDAFTAKPEDYHQIICTNLESVFFLTQQALPHLIKSKGTIINVSSIASERPFPKAIVYCMSKAALDSYTKSLALELAPYGVRVNSVNPGSVVSQLYKRGKEAFSEEKYSEFKKYQSSPALHPLGRMVLASEVADAIVFLASERASFLTGQMIFVDGGRHVASPQPKL